jgi:hypothetical protein
VPAHSAHRRSPNNIANKVFYSIICHKFAPIGAKAVERELQLVLTEAKSRGLNPEACFQVFDANGDGTITKKELRHVLEELGLSAGDGTSISEDQLTAVIDKFDRDGDGRINFKEFTTMLASGKGPGVAEAGAASLRALQQERERSKKLRRALARDLREALVEGHVRDQDVEEAFTNDATNEALDRRTVSRVLRKLHVRDSSDLANQVAKAFQLESKSKAGGGGGDREKRGDKSAMKKRRLQVIRFFELCCDPDGDDDAAASDGEASVEHADDTMGSDEDSCDSDGGPNKHIKDITEHKLRRKVRRVVKQSVLRGVEVQRLFASYDKADSGVMSSMDFEQALMDAGFSVYRSIGVGGGMGGGGMGGQGDPNTALTLYAEGDNYEERLISARRKLELLQVHRQRHNVAPKNERRRYREAMTTWGDAGFGGGEFAEQLTALEMVNRYREAQKRVVVSDMLKRAVTTKVRLIENTLLVWYYTGCACLSVGFGVVFNVN